MAKRMSIATLKRWWRNTRTQSYQAVSGWLRSVLRPLFRSVQQPQNSRSGFVLPTAALLLLVVSLVIAAVLLRTINRTEQVMGQRQEKALYNAATPAVERAKAKIEYMFTQDTRLPAKVPSQEQLLSMMLNNGKQGIRALPTADNPYRLKDEELIKVSGVDVPAWSYREDSNGDGKEDLTVAYSITWLIEDSEAGYEALKDTREQAVAARAKKMHVRSGPAVAEENKDCPTPEGQRIERGWFKDPVSSAILHKNFQIDAFAISDDENGTVATLEVQQDRRANRANKWGAWFRNDLEIFPGPSFNWNGAMYTNGSVFVGRPTGTRVSVTAFLVSSPKSCIYLAGADQSEIQMADPALDEATRTNYQGQVVSGLINTDAYGSQSVFHLWNEDAPITDKAKVTINPDTDSVNGSFKPSEIAIDPLVLFTEDRTVFRGNGLKREDQIRVEPETGPFSEKENKNYRRLLNPDVASGSPKVDDTYRADDRYGPIPGYGPKPEDSLIELGKKTGEPITGQLRFTSLDPVNDGVGDDLDMGLDGYWERRAWREGMRVITGQRLELGNDPLPVATDYMKEVLNIPVVNPNNRNREHETIQRRALRDNLAAVQATAIYHYKGGDKDLPVAALATTVHPGTAETLKRSSIFDKFDFTFKTKTPDTVFNGTFGDNPEELAVDFFTGRGTNGWEFDVTDSFFTNAEVQKALKNLANFAGDPKGAFPPVQETGAIIHPYPQLTKWGNFSNLRQSLQNPTTPESLADKTNKHTAALTLGMLAYNLQYLEAFDYAQNQTLITDLDTALALLSDLDFDNGEIRVKADTSNKKFVEIYPPNTPQTGTPPTPNGDPLVKFKGAIVTPEAYITALEARVNETGITPAVRQNRLKVAQTARLLYLKEQTLRDRTYGFRASPNNRTSGLPAALNNSFTYTLAHSDSTLNPKTDFPFGGMTYDKSAPPASLYNWVGQDEDIRIPGSPNYSAVKEVNFNCNFGTTTGNKYFGLGSQPGNDTEEHKFIRLASAICGINEDTNGDGILTNTTSDVDLGNNATLDSVKYPSLFYLFPKIAHNHLASAASPEIKQPTVATGLDPADKYLTDSYVAGLSNTYDAITDLSLVALKPKAIANWTLPNEVVNLPGGDCQNDHTLNNPNPNCSKYNLVWDGVNDQAYRVAFKDTALFNGREGMNVRVLNLDLELLKDEQINGDTWLAGGNSTDFDEGGIVYAFREDAVREDAIARPTKSNWNACDSANDIIKPACRTDVTKNQDPPVNANNWISPKPVDFYPDPDRRPYGFRLINGSNLDRPNAGGNIVYGMSLISDNPAYIQGDFNCHGSCDNPLSDVKGQSLLEIDANDLKNDPDKFYSRGKDNPSYAKKDTDSWRTTEVLVDAVTILSDNFCDGSIEDGIITTGDAVVPSNWQRHLGKDELKRNLTLANPSLQKIYGCQNGSTPYTSYLNQNRPNQAGTLYNVWLRENPADSGSPIQISKNGNPMLTTPITVAGQPDYNYKGRYLTISDGTTIGSQKVKPLIPAKKQVVSGMLLSNQVPSRSGQSNGGLQNFPRFLEDWRGIDLAFSGSLVQSNFSTSGTAPFDLDAWEPRQQPVVSSTDSIPYYFPPNRLWGYDVGLQVVPPAPIASRLITIAPTRSEFYRELPVDDPYIKNLSCAIGKGEGC
jgi:hypothetical protein